MTSLDKAYEWMVKLGCINEVVVDANRVLLSEQELLLEAGDTNVKHFRDWLRITFDKRRSIALNDTQLIDEERGFRDAFGLMLNGGNQYNPILIALANIAYNELGYEGVLRNRDNTGIFLFKKMAPLSITDPKDRQDPNSFYSRVREMVKRAWATKSNDYLPDFNYFLNEFGDRIYDEMEETAYKAKAKADSNDTHFNDADSDYPEIIKLNTREEAYKYGQYTGTNGKGAGALCYTTGSGMWDKFSNHDKNTLYVALHKDWQNVPAPAQKDKGYPKDAYGLSMVWFWIDERSGAVTNSNARWNHGFGGFDADNVFNADDLTDLLGDRFLILLGDSRILKIKQIKEHCLEHKSLDGLNDFKIKSRRPINIHGMEDKFILFNVSNLGYNILNNETGELLWKDRYEWFDDINIYDDRMLEEGLFIVSMDGRGQNIMDMEGNVFFKQRSWMSYIQTRSDLRIRHKAMPLDGLFLIENKEDRQNIMGSDGKLIWKHDKWFHPLSSETLEESNGNSSVLKILTDEGANLIDKDGNMLVNAESLGWSPKARIGLGQCRYHDLYIVSMTLDNVGTKYNILNPMDGKLVKSDLPWFDKIEEAHRSRNHEFIVTSKEKQGKNLLDSRWDLIWHGNDWFDDIIGWSGDIYIVTLQNGKNNVLNSSTGELLLKDSDANIVETYHNCFMFEKNGRYNFINTNGRIVFGENEPWGIGIKKLSDTSFLVTLENEKRVVYDSERNRILFNDIDLSEINYTYDPPKDEYVYEVRKPSEINPYYTVMNIADLSGNFAYKGDNWPNKMDVLLGFPGYYVCEYYSYKIGHESGFNIINPHGDLVWKNDEIPFFKDVQPVSIISGRKSRLGTNPIVAVRYGRNGLNVLDVTTGEMVFELSKLADMEVGDLYCIDYKAGLYQFFFRGINTQSNVYCAKTKKLTFPKWLSCIVEYLHLYGHKSEECYLLRNYYIHKMNLIDLEGNLVFKDKWLSSIENFTANTLLVSFDEKKFYVVGVDGSLKMNRPIDTNYYKEVNVGNNSNLRYMLSQCELVFFDAENDTWQTFDEFSRTYPETCASFVENSSYAEPTNGMSCLYLNFMDYGDAYNVVIQDGNNYRLLLKKWCPNMTYNVVEDKVFIGVSDYRHPNKNAMKIYRYDGNKLKPLSNQYYDTFYYINAWWNSTGYFAVTDENGMTNLLAMDGTLMFPNGGIPHKRLEMFKDSKGVILADKKWLYNSNGEKLSELTYKMDGSIYLCSYMDYYSYENEVGRIAVAPCSGCESGGANLLLPNGTLMFNDNEIPQLIMQNLIKGYWAIFQRVSSTEIRINFVYPNGKTFFSEEEPWPANMTMLDSNLPIVGCIMPDGSCGFIDLKSQKRFNRVQGRRILRFVNGENVTIQDERFWVVELEGLVGQWLVDCNGQVWKPKTDESGKICDIDKENRPIAKSNSDSDDGLNFEREENVNETITRVLKKRLKYLY